MRDPARIGRIIEKLHRAWHAHPDLRLGQLVHHLANPNTMAVHTEDDVLERRLDLLIEHGPEAL